jgi:hypothetical protein
MMTAPLVPEMVEGRQLPRTSTRQMPAKYIGSVTPPLKQSAVCTSYLQQLVDLLVASDELRPAPDRLVSHFHFSAELTPEEEKEKAKEEEEAAKAAAKATAPPVWTCAVCTFENAEAAPGCDMCGSPKPKAAKKAAGPGGADGSGSSLQAQDSSAMLHDMLSLIAGMRLLNGEVGVEESPAARAMLEAAWREVRRDQVQQRVIVIENVPQGERTLVQQAIAKALRAMDGTIRIEPNEIFIGTDPAKPPIKEPQRAEAAPALGPGPAGSGSGSGSAGRDYLRKGGGKAAPAPVPQSGSFSFRAVGDENGVLYHLGALAKEERREAKWVNPAACDNPPVSVMIGCGQR